MSNAGAGQAAGAAEEIAVRAYYLWEAAGRPEGRAIEHWLEAEARLRPANKPGDEPVLAVNGQLLESSGRRGRVRRGRIVCYGLVLGGEDSR